MIRLQAWLLAALGIITIIATLVAVFFLLPDIVPLHIGFNGVDRYGSKFEILIVGGLFTLINLMLVLSFIDAERLTGIGLIRGTNVKGTRVVVFIGVVLVDALMVAMLFFCLFAGSW